MIGLGIGASTTVFSLIHAVLIRSLPYGDAGRLVPAFMLAVSTIASLVPGVKATRIAPTEALRRG